MTLATFIRPADFDALIDAAFESETPVVAAAESDLGAPLQRYADAAAIKAKAAQCIAAGVRNYAFGLWYPSMKGKLTERRIELDPPREGHSFRHSLAGWGIVRLHLYVTPPDVLQCRVAAHSQGRAMSRQDRYPDLGPASAWDWQAVENHVFRLSRRLAKLGGKTGPVLQRAATPWELAASRKRAPSSTDD
ncbi:hypothetical protein [Solimonas soli]|uniref:hypothetical protein n=1 Tax=Solimonas soli TaxID=413479 RepID=UPI0004B006EC|nr:hypothetical protein [Solimonas soli]